MERKISLRAKIILCVFVDILIIAGAVLVWAVQTGKVSFFASESAVNKTLTVTDFSTGQPDSGIDNSSGKVQLASDNEGKYSSSGKFVSASIGGTDVESFNTFNPSTGTSETFVQNPGFETAGEDAEHPYSSWYLQSNPTGVITPSSAAGLGLSFTRESGTEASPAHGGDYYAKVVDGSSDNSINLTQTVPITPGKTYTLTAYMNIVPDGTSDKNTDVTLGIAFINNEIEELTPAGMGQWLGMASTPASTAYKPAGQWTKVTATGTAPNGSTRASVGISSTKLHKGSIYIDDFELTEQTGGPTYSPLEVKNKSFETSQDSDHPFAYWSLVNATHGIITASQAKTLLDYDIAKETTVGKTGHSYGYVSSHNPGSSINVLQQLPVTPGKKYVFSAWVLVPATVSATGVKAGMAFFDSTLDYTYDKLSNPLSLMQTPYPAATGDSVWHEITASAVAPSGSAFVLFGVNFFPYTGYAYFDEVNLSEETAVAATNPTNITYQFRGSPDSNSWSDWSTPQPNSSSISIANLIPTKSKYTQVQMNLSTTDTTKTPRVSSFTVKYTATTSTPINPGGGGGGGITPGGSGSPSGIKASTLVSTGGSLWFNLAIALVLSGIATWLFLRHKD